MGAAVYRGDLRNLLMLFVFLILASSGYSDPLAEARMNLERFYASDDAKPSFQPEVAYQKYFLSVQKKISSFRSAAEAIYYAQAQIPLDHRSGFSMQMAADYEMDLGREFPQYIEALGQLKESPDSKHHVIDFNGRSISNIFYFHCWSLFRCLSFIGYPKMICEIGSGYGALTRLWMENPIYSPHVYILIDYAECLFFAEVFLRSNLKNIKIVHLAGLSLDELQRIDFSEKLILLCPIGKEEWLKTLPIDLVINTCSMQHMPDAWIDYWMQWLDGSKAQYFYSSNFGAVALPKRPLICIGAADYAPRLSQKWSCLMNSSKGPFWPRELFPTYPGSVEIVAERKGPQFTQEELRAQFDLAIGKNWDRQSFIECLDILRYCPEEEMIWELICRSLKMGKEVPQEVRFLIKLLKQKGSESFLKDKLEDLNRTERYLNGFHK